MYFRKAGLLIVAISYILLATANGQEFSSTDFKVLNPVLHPGHFSSSGDFRLFGAIGQPAVGQSSSGDSTLNTIKAGFLYFADPSPAPSPSPTPSPSPSSGGGGGGTIIDIIGDIIDGIGGIFFPCRNSADLNCDGRVDIYDAAVMFYWWGKPLQQPRYIAAFGAILEMGRPLPDINRDQEVDIYDLSMMLSKWTRY